ncbi:MAG: copper resistance protein CopC, partial [Chloroflexi bacterium]|nr:copper resistance protein CopC [Chloroflexota bacterium]
MNQFRDRALKHLRMLALAVLMCAISATLASAHGSLIHAEPKPNAHLADAPRAVTLTFDEELDRRFSGVHVLDANQNVVDAGDLSISDDRKQMHISLLPNLTAGTYTVAYRTLTSVDGHITPGVYVFFVGSTATTSTTSNPTVGTVDLSRLPLDAGVRALNLLAALALCGAFALKLLMGDLDKDFASLRRTLDSRLSRWVLINLALLVAGIVVAQVLQAAEASGRSVAEVFAQGVWLNTLTETRYGQAALARLLLAATLFILHVGSNRDAERFRIKQLGNVRTLDALEFAVAGLILLSISLSSHAAAMGDVLQIGVLMDWVHLLAVGAWTGGLFALTVVVRPVLKRDAALQDVNARVLKRFSQLAIASVVVFTVTGLYASWRQVGSSNALTGTAYG